MVNDKKTDNPYRPYDLESGTWFYHEDVIKQIKEILETEEENRAIVLRGNPGSGKTSTLRRIENVPDLLGKKYIPIYLNSKEFIETDTDNLLLSVYRNVIEKLNKFGYCLSKPAYIKKQQSLEESLSSFLLPIDSILENTVTLVLIFDEFDSLLNRLNKMDSEIISTIFQYFLNIEKNWNNYALIFAGDRKLVNLTKSEGFRRFLQNAIRLDVEKVLDEKTVVKLIADPVKPWLEYSDEAVDEIIWLSGKNLYFQQLICYYLVNLLRDKKETICLKGHVGQVVNQILSDERPEFVFAWKNKISEDGRLIASALADQDVTENKDGKYYDIKENSLLDDIFGKKLFDELRTLEEFGNIHKAQGRRFFECPFKIPLYGKWIRANHPFMKTVFENIELISDRINLSTLIETIKETVPYKLSPFDKSTILEISEKWCFMKNRIIENRSTADRDEIKRFLECLSRLLKLSIKGIQSNKNYIELDIRELNIGILDEAFCFFQDRDELTEDYVFDIEGMAAAVAEDTQTKLTLFFYFQKSEMVESLVKKTFLNLIAIDENDIKKIILSQNPRDVFKKVILNRLSLQKVSPYQTAGPTKAVFYGRSNVINQITRSTDASYAIVGARKIGKSSLLLRIKEHPPANTVCIFMDLEIEFPNVKNYTAFLRSLEREIERVFKKKVAFGRLPFGKSLSKLPGCFQELSRYGKRIIFLLDEMDKLLEFDKKHDYRLIRIFRTISQKNYCQFVFAGFKELYHRKRDIENPAYNFYEEIRLKPLGRNSALELITKPMESIGVHYVNDEIKNLIFEYTAGHPNLIQFFCKKLVEKVEEHENTDDRRTIFRKDIEELFDSTYEEYIMDDVYMFFSDLSDINKLIILLLVEERKKKMTFSTDRIKQKLSENGIRIPINEVHKSLRNLVMRFILLDEGKDSYSFALPVFPDILNKRVGRDFKNDLIKEIKENEWESL